MQVLEIETILKKIINQEIFEGYTPDKALYLKIDEYVPYVCTALHNGHTLRAELITNCLLSESERWYEEDPHTLDFILPLPIVLSSNDSRYEYDLNRSEDEAIYTSAWGKTVWKESLNDNEIDLSITKYRNFYRVAEALITQLESIFPKVYVFDIHSYNYKRINHETPVFNLGTEGVNEARFKKEIDIFNHELTKIELPGFATTVRKNDVFQGKGHFTLYISEHFKNTLVFPLEIKKIYCDELTENVHPEIMKNITSQLVKGIKQFIKSLN